MYVGGGIPPLSDAAILDLNVPAPQWQATESMKFRRRQHNATLLPDGTVLVTGGTQGSGGETNGFNDLTPGQPIHAAELWNPKTGHWTVMASEDVDRCYHSTAILLPDATVLSAGGGEYAPRNDGVQNDPKDTHKDAQIFKPPYLFRARGSPRDLECARRGNFWAILHRGDVNPWPGRSGELGSPLVRHSLVQYESAHQFLEIHGPRNRAIGHCARECEHLPTGPLHALRPEQ